MGRRDGCTVAVTVSQMAFWDLVCPNHKSSHICAHQQTTPLELSCPYLPCPHLPPNTHISHSQPPHLIHSTHAIHTAYSLAQHPAAPIPLTASTQHLLHTQHPPAPIPPTAPTPPIVFIHPTLCITLCITLSVRFLRVSWELRRGEACGVALSERGAMRRTAASIVAL